MCRDELMETVKEFNDSARKTLRLGQKIRDLDKDRSPSWFSEEFAALFTDANQTMIIKDTYSVQLEQDKDIVTELSREWLAGLQECRKIQN